MDAVRPERRKNAASGGAAAFYTRYARLYDRLATDAPFIASLREATVDALAVERGDVVVEMGCGTGANLPVLRGRVGATGTIVGIDVSTGVLERARTRVDRYGWENVHLVRGDATTPPIADVATPRTAGPAGEVNCILASFVSGMVPNPAGVVERWSRLLPAGGRICLLDMARTTDTAWRWLNPAFRLFVRAGAPPAVRTARGSPARRLDRRVRDAHSAVHDVSRCARTRRRLGGFARITAGVVGEDSEGVSSAFIG